MAKTTLKEFLNSKEAIDVLLGIKIAIINDTFFKGVYFYEENAKKAGIKELKKKFGALDPETPVIVAKAKELAEKMGVHPDYVEALADMELPVNTLTPVKVELRYYFDAGICYYTSAEGVVTPKEGYVGPEPEIDPYYLYMFRLFKRV